MLTDQQALFRSAVDVALTWHLDPLYGYYLRRSYAIPISHDTPDYCVLRINDRSILQACRFPETLVSTTDDSRHYATIHCLEYESRIVYIVIEHDVTLGDHHSRYIRAIACNRQEAFSMARFIGFNCVELVPHQEAPVCHDQQ